MFFIESKEKQETLENTKIDEEKLDTQSTHMLIKTMLLQIVSEKIDKDLLVELEVPQESADLFLKLVDDIDGDIPRVEKGRLVKEKLRGLFKDEAGKIGTPKTSDNTKSLEEQLEALKKL